ncbi:MAG: 4Fe-4S binding protein [Chloroflexi bacterium]|nr:4Fe-4S binding protein [Chloroflexota bacterium]
MKIGTMLKDVFESFFKKPATQIYPIEKVATSDRFRGKLVFNPSACTGCCLCSKDCPSNAIELVTLDRAAKRFVLKYHLDRCVYCGQCVANCKFKCMSMSNDDWELAAIKKEAFEVYYGNENDIATFLEKLALPDPVSEEQPAKQ